MKKLILLSVILSSFSLCAVAADKNFGATAFNKWCKNCHGENGDKYGGGKSSQIAFLDKKDIITALKDYRSGKRDVHGMGRVMKSEVLTMKDDEIESVAEYVVSLKFKAKKITY